MIESEELIQEVLSLEGRDIIFTSFTIKAIVGSSLSLLRQEPSFAEVEQLDFNFYVSTKDCDDNSIAGKGTFTLADATFTYSFKVLRNPIPYMDGWSRISAGYTGKA
jgi:hypothetical protein